jgi:hypothetical protein
LIEDGTPVNAGTDEMTVGVTGQTVVEVIISVVTCPILAGQLVTVGAHEVIV